MNVSIQMPSIDSSFFNKLRCDYTHYPVLVETGTYMGETTFACEPLFEKVYTIEVDKQLYETVSRGYRGSKVTFLHGDSALVLVDLLPTIDKPAIFFLDGHWSSGNTRKGAKDCPLMEEVSHIATLFRHDGIIIIDDYRLFGKGPTHGTCNEDWETISKDEIILRLRTRLRNIYHLDSYLSPDDRLIIHIDKLITNP